MPYTQEQIINEIKRRLKLNIKCRDDYEERIEDIRHGTLREGVLYPTNVQEIYHIYCGAVDALAILLVDIEKDILLQEDFD